MSFLRCACFLQSMRNLSNCEYTYEHVSWIFIPATMDVAMREHTFRLVPNAKIWSTRSLYPKYHRLLHELRRRSTSSEQRYPSCRESLLQIIHFGSWRTRSSHSRRWRRIRVSSYATIEQMVRVRLPHYYPVQTVFKWQSRTMAQGITTHHPYLFNVVRRRR